MPMNSAQTWSELVKLEGAEFVRAGYREILQRDPDAIGLRHHVEALENGLSKAAIIESIGTSDEACLKGAALSPIAVRARREHYLEKLKLPGWVAPLIPVTLLRSKSEAQLGRKAQALRSTNQPQEAPSANIAKSRPVSVQRVSADRWQAGLSRGVSDPQIWFDLTTAFQWTEGVVGIVRAELELANNLKTAWPALRYSMQVDQGFVEIDEKQIDWLLNAENVTDAYMNFFGRNPGTESSTKTIHVIAPDSEGLFHPYEENDVILCVGWMDSQKEKYFSVIKETLQNIYIIYLIYDMILVLPESKHFYHAAGSKKFEDYIKWISHNCDLILFGGQTAKGDTGIYQRTHGWPTPPGAAIRFGTDIVKSSESSESRRDRLKKLGVADRFIMAVGSIEPRKNYETLYRAYLLAIELATEDLPQMVIVGKPMWRSEELVDRISRDPRVRGRILLLRPTDLELSALYNECLFTLLPSVYEGWSLTLPESLGQGKFCLCSDTPPLREIGQTLVDYVEPFDVRAWAEKIILYSEDDDQLRERSERIVSEWPTTRWRDTADMIAAAIESHVAAHPPSTIREEDFFARRSWSPPTVWMDLTLSYLQWQGGISGIVRAELEFARNLKTLSPDSRFFAYQATGDYFFEVTDDHLLWLFNEKDLSTAYQSFHDFWSVHEQKGSGFRDPFIHSGEPISGHPAEIDSFPPNTAVLFAGIDMDGTGVVHRTRRIFDLIEDGRGIMTCQVIYDLTPILYPQFHMKGTCIGFEPFLEHVSKRFDLLIYGGQTAQRDGVDVQRARSWRVAPSRAIQFGSNIRKNTSVRSDDGDSELLANLGVRSDFVLCVGTIEPRKNHEVLYKAYLRLLKSAPLQRPLQFVFAGKKGWNSDDFLAVVEGDERTRGGLIVTSPTDEELDALYRNCLFTLLPSFYEGWSLTLPESLSYGKLCIASDVDPLRETGGDLIEYVNALDPYAWADKIAHYANDKRSLSRREDQIRARWKPLSWRDSSEKLAEELVAFHKSKFIHLFERNSEV